MSCVKIQIRGLQNLQVAAANCIKLVYKSFATSVCFVINRFDIISFDVNSLKVLIEDGVLVVMYV